MPTEAQVPADDPMMLAWKAYQATDDYRATRRWAAHEIHTEGSLWASFVQGYQAAQNAAQRNS